MKRALIIVASLIVVIGLVAVIYYLYFAPSAQLTVDTSGNFPSSGAGNATSTNNSVGDTTATVVAPGLVEITSSPVSAGEVAFDMPAPAVVSTTTSLSTTTVGTAAIVSQSGANGATAGDVDIHYIDRESGNVYSYLANAHTLTRVSDKTLPGIQEASWLPDGSTAFVRFLADVNGAEHIDSYALPYNGAGGYFLEQDLNQVMTIGSSTLFTLTANDSGSIGSIANPDGTNVHTLFTSPLTSIEARPAGSNIIAVTKASSELNGFAFTLSPATGNFTPILGPLPGLTILPSPDGKQVLYSYVNSGAFKMAVLNLGTGVSTNLPLATLAEKCVWTSDSTALYCAIPTSFTGNLPDDWYQGVVSFTDKIWRIDLTSRLATLVLDPSSAAKVDIDAVNLTIDPNSQVLVFRNKKDSSLWAYSL
jgi:hypothetical protein